MSAESEFAALYEAEYAKFVRRARHQLPTPEDAEDIVATAFTELWRRWHDVENPGAYVYRSIQNAIVDFYRKHRDAPSGLPDDSARRRTIALEELFEYQSLRDHGERYRNENSASYHFGLFWHGGYEQVEWHLFLQRCLGLLNQKQHSVFVAHFFEGRSFEETAEQHGITVGATKARIFRGRHILRQAFPGGARLHENQAELRDGFVVV